MVTDLEIASTDHQTSVEKSIETSRKVAHVIQHLITKENMLNISQDAKIKNERYLTLTNFDESNFNNMISGSNEAVY